MSLRTVLEEWRGALRGRGFAASFAVTVLLLVATLASLSAFLEWIEARPGVTVPDPLLAMVAPRDFTWLTFGAIYGALVAAILSLAPHPRRLLFAMQCYVTLVLIRMACMASLPLEPPPTMIALVDPIVQAAGSGAVLTKDLFFSGHTSTLLLLALTAQKPLWRRVFLAATAVVAVCVLWQHVHYTADVLVAVLAAVTAHRAVSLAHDRPAR
jgi:hypothetical protein